MKPFVAGCRSVVAGILLTGVVGCGGSSRESLRRELIMILEQQRAAHLESDASAIAENVADSLVSVDAGVVNVQTRSDVEAMFASYFRGSIYRRWEDVDPPLVRISSDGSMAWVVRTVLVDRDEPATSGGMQNRRFTSAYTSTFERIDGEWQMTSVTSTFPPVEARSSTAN